MCPECGNVFLSFRQCPRQTNNEPYLDTRCPCQRGVSNAVANGHATFPCWPMKNRSNGQIKTEATPVPPRLIAPSPPPRQCRRDARLVARDQVPPVQTEGANPRSSHFLPGLPVRRRLHAPSQPPAIARRVSASATERQPRALPTTEQTGPGDRANRTRLNYQGGIFPQALVNGARGSWQVRWGHSS